MAIISNEDVKKHCPEYQHYFVDENNQYQDIILEAKIEQAERLLYVYYAEWDETLHAEEMKFHAIRITIYEGFKIKHSGTDFTTIPAIVKDYQETIDLLKRYQSGVSKPTVKDTSLTSGATVISDGRQFREGFH